MTQTKRTYYVGNHKECLAEIMRRQARDNPRTRIITQTQLLKGMENVHLVLCRGWKDLKDIETEIAIMARHRGTSIEVAA